MKYALQNGSGNFPEGKCLGTFVSVCLKVKWNADEERACSPHLKLTSEKMDQKYSGSGDRLMFAKSNALKREKVPPLNNLTLTNKKLTNHIQDCDEMNYWLFIKGTSPLTSHSNFLFHQHSTGNCS